MATPHITWKHLKKVRYEALCSERWQWRHVLTASVKSRSPMCLTLISLIGAMLPLLMIRYLTTLLSRCLLALSGLLMSLLVSPRLNCGKVSCSRPRVQLLMHFLLLQILPDSFNLERYQRKGHHVFSYQDLTPITKLMALS